MLSPRQRMNPDGDYIFQQDSTPAHTAQTTQEFLRENIVDFWTPSGLAAVFAGPEPAELCYMYLESFERKVQARPHASLATLHRSTTKEWNRMSPAYVHWTCHSFHHHLETVVLKHRGAYIE